MKTIKFFTFLFLLLIIFGSFTPQGYSACKDFLNETSDYRNKIMVIISRMVELKVELSTAKEKNDYDQKKKAIFREFRNLVPPKELLVFHKKIQKHLKYTDEASKALNVRGDRATFMKYSQLSTASFDKAFEELKKVLGKHDCAVEF